MERLFLTVLHMSITSSYVILIVAAVRFFLKKLPKVFSYLLWFVVLFRLLCPFSLQSAVSFVPQRVSIQDESTFFKAENSKPEQTTAFEETGGPDREKMENTGISKENSKKTAVLKIAALVWFDFAVLFLCYHIFLTFRLRNKLLAAQRIEKGIYEAEGIKTPFVFGVFHSRIYIPLGLSKAEKRYMVCHEQMHRKRGDPFVKLLLFLALCIHWFNPFVWLAFYMAVKDMEMSCDESVIRVMGKGIKKEYTASLLTLAAGKAVWNQMGPLAFGEGDVKNRVKNVLNYKKPAFWMVCIGIAAVVVIGVGLALNPLENPKAEETAVQAGESGEGVEEKLETENPDGEGKTPGISENTGSNSISQPEKAADSSMDEDIDSLEMDKERKEHIKEVLGKNYQTMEELANAWASAVSDRDGHIVYGLLTDKGKKNFYEIEYVMSEKEDSYKAIGWSSPWPWGEEQYRLVIDGDTADITYYAIVSDPHIYIFRETIRGVRTDKGYRVDSNQFKNYTEVPIKTKEEFEYVYKMGYPDYSGEFIDQGFAEALQRHEGNSYNEDYFKPDTAMIYILGLEGGTAEILKESDGEALVRYTFMDGEAVEVPMYQPVQKGKDGIWVIQTKK